MKSTVVKRLNLLLCKCSKSTVVNRLTHVTLLFMENAFEHSTAYETASNENIVITKPDKGLGVVILNKNGFIDKMLVILDDPLKFEKLGPTSTTTTLLILNQNFKNVY